MPKAKLEPISFAVDAALLRELGERLVGRPHIALAELIKNSYDADATLVEVAIDEGRLTVSDDGHGMSRKAFQDRWMRVGSPHKERERISPQFKRPLTGSKGIGRLAVQFLGSDLKMWTQIDGEEAPQLYAEIDWRTARTKDLITEASAMVGRLAKPDRRTFSGGADHGTIIEITDLNQEWTEAELIGLAQEVWALQPPFSPSEGGFEIKLQAPPRAAESFEEQIRAYLDVWYARIKGELRQIDGTDEGLLQAELRFADGERYSLELPMKKCRVHHASIELRMYYLRHRQPRNLSVGQLRNYFNEWGGVHVYDAGFRLPYYGPDEDWLGIEMDYSHRLSASNLLPETELVKNGLRFLPSNSRLYGEVRVSTNDERQYQREDVGPQDVLQIQASRDRLVDNRAFEDLRDAVRTLLDWYANREAARASRRHEETAEAERVSDATEYLDEVVESLKPELGGDEFSTLREAVDDVRGAEDAASAERDRQTRLMATLASAGAASLAYEHEVGKQLRQLEAIEHDLTQAAKRDAQLRPLAEELRAWVKRTKQTRGLFSPLLNEEEREEPRALLAREAVKQIIQDLEFILQGVPVSVALPAELRLPKARLIEWSAIFQNSFTNAVSAMAETRNPEILVTGGSEGRNHYVRIQDKGIGIDLDDAERLFQPFERGDRHEVGMGTGLGLAILKMLAESIGIRVRFDAPDEGWATSLRLSWRPKS